MPALVSLKAFSDRDRALAAIGDACRDDREFDAGSKSKADNDDFDQLVGKRLAQARRMARMTPDDAAEKLRISKQTLYKYEKGERTLKAKTLYDAVRLYGVDAGWLLCLTDDLKVTRMGEDGRTITVTYKSA